jgi:hypothetical protein
MAERWEHIAVRSYNEPRDGYDRKWWVEIHQPDGSTENAGLEDNGTTELVVLLNRLGAEGWQLVSTEVTRTSNYTMRTMWLHRRLQ